MRTALGRRGNKTVCLLVLLVGVLGAGARGQSRGEEIDYFKKWLQEEVVYLITDEERQVFLKLTTPEEKERFIEQFWLRRDPTPGTAINEFKDEHYRRLAYVNERFGSGIPGWKTDRGRVYIKFGPPDEIDSRPSGGTYFRPYHEGGGVTQTFPFEVWWYRHIEGVGDDIEFEFVDRSWSGEYKLAQRPEEKDLFLYVDGAGPTLKEYLGHNSRLYRPAYQPGLLNSPSYLARGNYLRSKDMPFARLERFFATQRPPSIQFTDLKRIVETRLVYQDLPFALRQDAVRLSGERWLVPVTIAVRNRDLDFRPKGELYRSEVQVYGMVTGVNGRVLAEFEDIISRQASAGELEEVARGLSHYQKVLALPPGLYKLTLVLRNGEEGKIGSGEARISLPKIQEGKLAGSSLILASQLERLEELPEEPQQFVLGDYKVVPSVANYFSAGEPLGVYLQLYNAGLDQQSQAPALQVNYYLLDSEGKLVRRIEELGQQSVVFYSDQRVVLARQLSLQGISPGGYRLRVTVEDRITGQSISAEDQFQVY